MKNRMVFHYLFTLWISFFALIGILYLLFIPNHISALFTSYNNDPNSLLFWSSVIAKDILMGCLGVLAIPIFYSLLHRVNLNLRKMTIFLWTYLVSRIIMTILDRIGELNSTISLFSIVFFGVEIVVAFYIIQAILDYYQSRVQLFSTESKEFQRAKFKAYINRLTFGFISFER